MGLIGHTAMLACLTVLPLLPQALAQQAVEPFVQRHIYPDVAEAKPDIVTAMRTARREHKRILLDFGGDWCGDCQVLNMYFHDEKNQPLLEKNFVVVPVNVGRIDENLDIGERYGVDLKKGVPALAVLTAQGQPLYGQSGEFSRMRHMESSAVTEFLNKWKQK